MGKNIKVAIVGATGYAGAELVRLLLGHKGVEIKYLCSKTYENKAYSSIYKNMFKIIDEPLVSDDLSAISKEVDVIFTATPQGYLSGIINREILDNCKIIDLSADFRIKKVATYEHWYGIEHKATDFIDEAVYGLCEIYRDKIKDARLVANPGCYTTCSILSLYPLVKEGIIDTDDIVIDAKSGTSGAGRGAKVDSLFCEVNENIKAYGITSHRHTPEIEQELSFACNKEVVLQFTPHLVPMNRGILATIYTKPIVSDLTMEKVRGIYEKYYGKERFIRLLDDSQSAETKWVEGSNLTDISFKTDPRTKRLIVVSALDNLVKGAAGQAMQNMNIMFGFEEGEGLYQAPMFP